MLHILQFILLLLLHTCSLGASTLTCINVLMLIYRFTNRICHKHNIFLHAEHIKGTDIFLSDFVSRNMEHEFLQQCLQEGRTVKRVQVLPVTLQPSLSIPPSSFHQFSGKHKEDVWRRLEKLHTVLCYG